MHKMSKQPRTYSKLCRIYERMFIGLYCIQPHKPPPIYHVICIISMLLLCVYVDIFVFRLLLPISEFMYNLNT